MNGMTHEDKALRGQLGITRVYKYGDGDKTHVDGSMLCRGWDENEGERIRYTMMCGSTINHYGTDVLIRKGPAGEGDQGSKGNGDDDI